MIAVGAAFKFHSGTDEKRAPQWMVKLHLEFLFRIMCDPKKTTETLWLDCVYTTWITL